MRLFFATALSVSIFAEALFAQCTTNVSGTIAGQHWTLAGSPYCVVGNISVASLIIDPGVVVKFGGPYRFEVASVLTAVGTQQDSIRFQRDTSTSPWKGIVFNFSNPGSELAYCIIEGSDSSGIRNYHSSPRIRNCTIRNNMTSYRGGGLYSDWTLTLSNCRIERNRCTGLYGGGIYSTGRLKLLDSCRILRNVDTTTSSSIAQGGGIYSSGGLHMKLCTVSGNVAVGWSGAPYRSHSANGGGIYLASDSLILENCVINNNFAAAAANTAAEVALGGGIFVASGIASIANCILGFNSLWSREFWAGSRAQGGGVYVALGTVGLLNSTVAYNTFDGLYRSGGAVAVKNCVVYYNGLNLSNPRPQIIGSVTVTHSDVQGDPVYPGQGNINVNPNFRSHDSLRIVTPSLCIDAGDPSPAYNDPADPTRPGFARWPALGTLRNDMGAHGGPGALPTSVKQLSITSLPAEFLLFQNYPNPFNPSTRIRYGLPRSSFVTLTVYSLLGQQVSQLVSEEQEAGYHDIVFRGDDRLSSGIYFYRLVAGSYSATKKFILLR